MSFPINTSIPNANDYPGDDQPGMQTNFANINSYLSIDHVQAGLSGNGFHKEVTFNSNNVPAVFPVTPPVLFTNNQDGAGNALPGSLSELFYYTGTATDSKNQYVSTSNGSVLLFGGIIMKWGTANLPGTGFNQPVTFPVAFPNNCFLAVAIATNTGTGAVTVNVDTSFSASGFVAIKSSASTSLDIVYIAIGN